MSDLKKATEEELLAELQRRQKPQAPAPMPVKNSDFGPLIKMVTEIVAQSILNGYENDDFKSYVFEVAMTAIYGPGYWPWRNGQKW